jgi:ppGpp synthetase/RelA/SpoT-type nucleotidyltranferase
MKCLFANSLDVMLDGWSESAHPRVSKGKGGGQFTSKGGSGSAQAGAGSTSPAAAKAVAAPAIPPEIHAHVADYQRLFPKTWKRFNDSMSSLGSVTGRVKAADSLQDKLEGRYKDNGWGLEHITDTIGMRCTSETLAGVYEGVAAVQKQFKVTTNEKGEPDVDDKMIKPQGFYRAVHIIVDSLDKTGVKRAEIQVRTIRQSNVADWGHDIAYKGKFAKHAEVRAYANAVGDANWELDNGREAKMPEPPEILKKHGLEFDPAKTYYSHWLAKEKPEFL